nr:MAG TPA: hypothetical protein [Caudoviricetes sp.]
MKCLSITYLQGVIQPDGYPDYSILKSSRDMA